MEVLEPMAPTPTDTSAKTCGSDRTGWSTDSDSIRRRFTTTRMDLPTARAITVPNTRRSVTISTRATSVPRIRRPAELTAAPASIRAGRSRRLLKPVCRERRQFIGCGVGCDPFADEFSGRRGQQHAIAKMSAGEKQVVEARGPVDGGEAIGGGRTPPAPGARECHVAQRRNQSGGRCGKREGQVRVRRNALGFKRVATRHDFSAAKLQHD